MMLFGFTACQKADIDGIAAGGESIVTFSATLPAEMAGTRAAGDGTQVNRCIMEIYLNGVLYGQPSVAVISNKQATFSARLISGKTYDLVFWADAAKGTTAEDFEDNHYVTSSLTNVTVKDADAYNGNDDTRDAFFATQQLYVEQSSSVNVKMYRPFGQLNVKTLDIQEVKDANIASLIPSHVSIAFKAVPTGINLLTGELLETTDAIVYAEKSAVIDENGTLSMDYVFAPKGTEQYLADFTMSFFNAEGGEAAADYEFTNIPLQRNYRTNVSGNLLTKKTDITVDVVPDFEDEDIDYPITDVVTVAEANEALAAGKTIVSVAEAPTADAELILPQSTSPVTVLLPALTHKLTVKYSEGAVNPEKLDLTIPSVENLEIVTPNTTVTLNGAAYNTVSASTADNTLVVSEDVVIEELTLVKGNAKLYGEVKAIVRAAGYKGVVYRCFDSQTSFDRLVADNVSGYDEILVEKPVAAVDAKNAALTRQLTVAAPATISNLNIAVDYKGAYGLKIVSGADKVAIDNFVVSSTKNADRTAWVECENADCLFTNGKFIAPTQVSDKSGLNLVAASGKADMKIMLDNVLISTSSELFNVDKTEDYEYSEAQKSLVPAYSRGITFGFLGGIDETKTSKIKLTMKNSAIEGVYYCINVVPTNSTIDVDVDNCVFDGRAALNLWGKGVGTFNIKDSKLIGRNWFGGPTEEFATLVYNWNSQNLSQEAANKSVVLDGCDVVSDNNPQTDTNRQYMASIRSREHNSLEIKNGTIFRETVNPRLDYAVQVHFPDANDVAWDDTFEIRGKEGAAVCGGALVTVVE